MSDDDPSDQEPIRLDSDKLVARILRHMAEALRAGYTPGYYGHGGPQDGDDERSPTNAPLGTLARLPLRRLRQGVHGDLDAVWKTGLVEHGQKDARRRTYAWLAKQLGLPKRQCHVAEFDEDMCERALVALKGASWTKVIEFETAPPVFKLGDVVAVERGGETQLGVIESPPYDLHQATFYTVQLDGRAEVSSIPDSDLDHAPIVDVIARMARVEPRRRSL